jgi:hypothetical protein
VEVTELVELESAEPESVELESVEVEQVVQLVALEAG